RYHQNVSPERERDLPPDVVVRSVDPVPAARLAPRPPGAHHRHQRPALPQRHHDPLREVGTERNRAAVAEDLVPAEPGGQPLFDQQRRERLVVGPVTDENRMTHDRLSLCLVWRNWFGPPVPRCPTTTRPPAAGRSRPLS